MSSPEKPRSLERGVVTDPVNHPDHYNAGKVEAIDAIASATAGHTGEDAYLIGNAIKYLFRLGRKGSALEDARKARWHIERLIRNLEEQE